MDVYTSSLLCHVFINVLLLSTLLGECACYRGPSSSLAGREQSYNITETKIAIGIGIIVPAREIPKYRESCWSLDYLLPTVKNLKLPAITNAIMKRNIRISVAVRDTRCSDIYGPVGAMELMYEKKRDIHVFLGPCCKIALAPVARYSKAWGVPIITPGGLTAKFSDKTQYPLLTRIMPPYNKLTAFLAEVVNAHDFSHTALLWHDYKTTTSECSEMMHSLYGDNQPHLTKYRPYTEVFNEDELKYIDIGQIIERISNHSRGKVHSATV